MPVGEDQFCQSFVCRNVHGNKLDLKNENGGQFTGEFAGIKEVKL